MVESLHKNLITSGEAAADVQHVIWLAKLQPARPKLLRGAKGVSVNWVRLCLAQDIGRVNIDCDCRGLVHAGLSSGP